MAGRQGRWSWLGGEVQELGDLAGAAVAPPVGGGGVADDPQSHPPGQQVRGVVDAVGAPEVHAAAGLDLEHRGALAV